MSNPNPNARGGVAKKATKPAKLAPHQLTAKAQGLPQPQEGGSFIRQPDTKELVKREAPAEPAPPVDQSAQTTTDTSGAAGNGAPEQGN